MYVAKLNVPSTSNISWRSVFKSFLRGCFFFFLYCRCRWVLGLKYTKIRAFILTAVLTAFKLPYMTQISSRCAICAELQQNHKNVFTNSLWYKMLHTTTHLQCFSERSYRKEHYMHLHTDWQIVCRDTGKKCWSEVQLHWLKWSCLRWSFLLSFQQFRDTIYIPVLIVHNLSMIIWLKHKT